MVVGWLSSLVTQAGEQRGGFARLAERCQIGSRGTEGETNEQIAQALGFTLRKVARWRSQFMQGGRAGLEHDAAWAWTQTG